MAAPDLYFANRAQRDQQYNARATVADFDACMRTYLRLCEQAKQQCPGVYNLAYGQKRTQVLDLFPLDHGQNAAVFVFIHGGYWRALSKDYACMMAPALRQAGIALCTLNYSLLPKASLYEAVADVRAALAWLYRNGGAYGLDPERMVVSGSSAGAHLAAMLAAEHWPEDYYLPAHTIKGLVGLSGLYDVKPLCDTHINEWLQLYPDQAKQLSPLYCLPRAGLPVVLAVGGQETDGFKNQTQAYAQACRAKGLIVTTQNVPNCHHFDLVHELCDPNSALMRAAIKLCQSAK